MRVLSLATVGAAVLTAGTAARGALVLDFETAGQYAQNFRKIAGPGNPTQTGPSEQNDTVRLGPATSNFTAVYDTTPADALEKSVFTVSPGNPLTFSTDLLFTTATSSFGVYIVDANNEAAGYLALLNIDQTNTTSELIRFASNAVPNTGAAGTLVSGGSGDSIALNQTANAVFTYSIDQDNHPVLTITAGSLTGSTTFDTITTPLTDVQVGIRVSTQNVGQIDFDNVTIDAVPEPASLGIVAAAALLSRRRRRS